MAVKTRKRTKALPELPPEIEVEMYYIGRRGEYLRKPIEARFASRDIDKVMAWGEYIRSKGYISAEEVQAEKEAAPCEIQHTKVKKGEFDPASVANKKSGRGLKPYRKPVYDKDKRPLPTTHGWAV